MNGSSLTATANPNVSQVTIIPVLRDVIRTHFAPPHSALPQKTLVRAQPREMDEKESDLGKEVLGFLEALCWGAPNNLESR